MRRTPCAFCKVSKLKSLQESLAALLEAAHDDLSMASHRAPRYFPNFLPRNHFRAMGSYKERQLHVNEIPVYRAPVFERSMILRMSRAAGRIIATAAGRARFGLTRWGRSECGAATTRNSPERVRGQLARAVRRSDDAFRACRLARSDASLRSAAFNLFRVGAAATDRGREVEYAWPPMVREAHAAQEGSR
jgi:hypothetical protein